MKIKKSDIYSSYWFFSFLRQERFLEKINKKYKANDDDCIFNNFKFTNCYRSCDRVSQFLISNISNDIALDYKDVFLRTIIFKLFNKIDTWNSIEDIVGSVSVSNFSVSLLKRYIFNSTKRA